MYLESYKVEMLTTDITELVANITLFESINGYLQGNIRLLDGINVYDEVIGVHNRLPPVLITINYAGNTEIYSFVVDGINQMTIDPAEKEYVIHLITPQEQALKLVNINHVYSGASEEIVRSIFETSTGESSKLIINTLATSKGKYVVPNISAYDAIKTVVSHAVDENHSGFYFYQRLTDQGTVRLGSLYGMSNDKYSTVKLSNNIPQQKDISDSTAILPGTTNDYKLEEYRMYHTDKLAAGEYGNKIHHMELDETNINKNEPLESASEEITIHKLPKNLYTNVPPAMPPGPHFEAYPKSLFRDSVNPSDMAALNQQRRVYNAALNVSKIVPVIGCGVGKSIEVEIGYSDVSSSISNGFYIISDINHTFNHEGGGKMDYLQQMKLIREYA